MTLQTWPFPNMHSSTCTGICYTTTQTPDNGCSVWSPRSCLTCIEPAINTKHLSYQSFQLFGFDFMVDESFKVWLIEINGAPACAQSVLFLYPFPRSGHIHICSALRKFSDPSHFPHFVTLEPYSKIDFTFYFNSSIYTQYPLTAKWKQVVRNVCTFIKNKQQKYLVYIRFRPFAMRLEIELRCILFPWIILEMFLQLDWSPPVVNSIVWTWFGKAHTCLYTVDKCMCNGCETARLVSRCVNMNSNSTFVRFASSSSLCVKHCAVYDFKPINSRDEASVTDVKWLAS
jgi:hypothetical protein